MDTFEELNGTYFYHGHTNVSAGELFNLIFLQNFADSFGMDIGSAATILIGQPYIPVSGKLAAGHKQIISKTKTQYNLIARPKDLIQ